MKTTIMNVIVVAALSFSGASLAAAETAGKVQSPASAVPPAPAQASQPAVKPSVPVKPAKAKKRRSQNLDLRHCLDLKTDAEIAKCAGET